MDVGKLEEEIGWLKKKREREQRIREREHIGVDARELGGELTVPN